MSDFKSYGWGILRAAGSPVFDEYCVAPRPDELEDLYVPDHGETLVDLFYRLPEKPADDYTARMAEAQATREELGRAPDHTEDSRTMVEPAPARGRWRGEGCGWEGTEAELATSNGHADIGRDANGEPEQILCGPCHPVGCVAAEAEVAALQGGIIARV